MIFRTTRYNLISSCVAVFFAFIMIANAAMAQYFADPNRNKWKDMNRITLTALRAGKYAKGAELGERAYQFALLHFGKKDPYTLTSINNLAELYRKQGRYEEAEPLFKDAFKGSKSVLGLEDPATLLSLNNLAMLYMDMGRFKEAEEKLKEALDNNEKIFGPNHANADTLQSMNNLAALYDSLGRYGEAESHYEKALSICKSLFGTKHPSTLNILSNLAIVYREQFRYKDAKELNEKVLSLRESILGPKHPDTLASMNNLAFLYNEIGLYNKAESLFEKALDLRKSILTINHQHTLISIINLAGFYHEHRLYAKAELNYQKALNICENLKLESNHPISLTISNNLAFFYSDQGLYEDAEDKFKEVLALRETILGSDHPHTLETRIGYAICLINRKDYDGALLRLKEAEAPYLAWTGSLLKTTQKQRVRGQHLFFASSFQNVALTFASMHLQEGSKEFAADVLLRWKGIQAEEDAYMAHLVQTTKDPEVRSLGRELMYLRSFLPRLPQEKGNDQRQTLIARLEALELNLAGISREYKDALQVFNAGMDRIRYALPPKTALIEFRHFYPVDFKTGDFGDLQWTAVLVYSKGSGDGLVYQDLGSVDATRELWAKLRSTKDKAEAKRLSGALYQNLFAKFDDKLNDFDTLYIAPDGFLHQVAFSRLILPDGRYWAKRQQIRRVHTGRDLVRKWQAGNNGKLLALGDIDYERYPTGQKQQAAFLAEELNPIFSETKHVATVLNEFEPLSESRKEVQKIGFFCKKRRGLEIQALYDIAASEGYLKQMEEVPAVLHLSTHGFFLPDDGSIERPLVLSGLALAGANRTIANNSEPDRDDGLLFSMEVLGLNLEGTELVSLSSCSTVKGRIDYSEGVYGLVRAFRVAGAKSVLMTLWPVNDSDAKDFMTLFYKYWLSQPADQSDAALALHQSRLDYIDWGVDPDVWAPYVLVGE